MSRVGLLELPPRRWVQGRHDCSGWLREEALKGPVRRPALLADERVDVGQATLQHLLHLLQQRGVVPSEALASRRLEKSSQMGRTVLPCVDTLVSQSRADVPDQDTGVDSRVLDNGRDALLRLVCDHAFG